MSIADAHRIIALETTVAELLERVAALEGRQEAEPPPAMAGGRDCNPPALWSSSAPVDDAVAVLGKHGGDRRSAAAKAQAGHFILNGRENTKAHWLARLNRDRPDLAEKVLAGELSAHAAAVAAGFKRRMISVPADAEAARRSGGS